MSRSPQVEANLRRRVPEADTEQVHEAIRRAFGHGGLAHKELLDIMKWTERKPPLSPIREPEWPERARNEKPVTAFPGRPPVPAPQFTSATLEQNLKRQLPGVCTDRVRDALRSARGHGGLAKKALREMLEHERHCPGGTALSSPPGWSQQAREERPVPVPHGGANVLPAVEQQPEASTQDIDRLEAAPTNLVPRVSEKPPRSERSVEARIDFDEDRRSQPGYSREAPPRQQAAKSRADRPPGANKQICFGPAGSFSAAARDRVHQTPDDVSSNDAVVKPRGTSSLVELFGNVSQEQPRPRLGRSISHSMLAAEKSNCCAETSTWLDRVRNALAGLPHESLSTLRITALTVFAVLMSRSWNFYLTRFTLYCPRPPEQLLTCHQSSVYFSMMVITGPLLLGASAHVVEHYRDTQVGKLITASVGLLVGWSYKDLVEACHDEVVEAADVLLADYPGWVRHQGINVLFVLAVTFLSVLMVYVIARSYIFIYRRADRTNSTLLTRVGRYVQKLSDLINNGCGLGVAASWQLMFETFLRIRSYAQWTLKGGDVQSGHEASLLGDLPAPVVGVLTYAFSLIGTCVVLNRDLDKNRRRDMDLIMEQAARVMQCAVRGLLARLRRRKGELGRSAAVESEGAESRQAAAAADAKKPSAVDHEDMAPFSSSLHSDEEAAARRLTRMSTRSQRTSKAVAAVQRRRAKERLHMTFLRLHVVLLTMLSKCLGFLVGWAWYDVAIAILAPRKFTDERFDTDGLSELFFAVTVTIACTGYTLRFLSQQKEPGGQASEHTFLANALGLVQGWAWSDCVDGNFLELMKKVPTSTYEGTAWAFVVPNLLCLALTLLLTLLVFGLRAWVAKQFQARARMNWRVSRSRLVFLREVTTRPSRAVTGMV